MKKLLITIIITLFALTGCKGLEKNVMKEKISIHLTGDISSQEKIGVLLFAYDERIADKKATLIEEKDILLKKHENIIDFYLPLKIEDITENRVYYISLKNNDKYIIDYNSGNVFNLKKNEINKIKLKRK